MDLEGFREMIRDIARGAIEQGVKEFEHIHKGKYSRFVILQRMRAGFPESVKQFDATGEMPPDQLKIIAEVGLEVFDELIKKSSN